MLNNVNLQNPNKTDLILEALNTMSGDIVTFEGVGGMPLKKLKVNIEPVQAGSGDPSPDNVRPITGWTGAKVTRTGKNLFNPHLYNGGRYNPTVGAKLTLTESQEQFTPNADNTTFTITLGPTWSYKTLLIPVENFEAFYLSYQFTSTGQGGRSWGYLDKDFTVLTTINSTDASANYASAWNPGLNADRAYYYLVITNRGSANATITLTNPICTPGSTATAYEPYQGESYDITFPSEAGTVYGGTLDVTNGVLMVDRAMIASYDGETLPNEWISDRDIYVAGTTPTTGAQVVYELATPITYILTPQEVTTLLGTNNIWADTGDVEVQYGQYLSTLKEYIDAKVADLQAQIDANEEVEP